MVAQEVMEVTESMELLELHELQEQQPQVVHCQQVSHELLVVQVEQDDNEHEVMLLLVQTE